MIFTERTIKMSNDVCEIDNPIVLYRGDYNVEIRFNNVFIDASCSCPVHTNCKHCYALLKKANKLLNDDTLINYDCYGGKEINNELNRRDSLASRLIVPENSPLNNTSINNFENHIVSQPDIPINSFPSRGRQRIQDEVDTDDYVSPLFAPQGSEDFYV